MSNVVFVVSMPDGSYESVGMMECEIKNNSSYPNMNVCKKTVESKEEFQKLMTDLVKEFSKQTILILHLCVHGNEYGIAFKGYDEANPSSDYCMLWDELVQTVKPLNEAVNCNLILVLQACKSSKLGEKMPNPDFCKYLIVGDGLVYSRELEPLFQFYKTYAETKDVKLAYKAMDSTKYYDVKHNEIQISSVCKLFPNDEIKK